MIDASGELHVHDEGFVGIENWELEEDPLGNSYLLKQTYFVHIIWWV